MVPRERLLSRSSAGRWTAFAVKLTAGHLHRQREMSRSEFRCKILF
jgi:hypothetical protein